jgi:hypothetical protein
MVILMPMVTTTTTTTTICIPSTMNLPVRPSSNGKRKKKMMGFMGLPWWRLQKLGRMELPQQLHPPHRMAAIVISALFEHEPPTFWKEMMTTTTILEEEEHPIYPLDLGLGTTTTIITGIITNDIKVSPSMPSMGLRIGIRTTRIMMIMV